MFLHESTVDEAGFPGVGESHVWLTVTVGIPSESHGILKTLTLFALAYITKVLSPPELWTLLAKINPKAMRRNPFLFGLSYMKWTPGLSSISGTDLGNDEGLRFPRNCCHPQKIKSGLVCKGERSAPQLYLNTRGRPPLSHGYLPFLEGWVICWVSRCEGTIPLHLQHG